MSDMAATPVCTTCPYCGVGCGVLAKPDAPVTGDPNHPANFGRLCSKGSALGETLGNEGRLLAPQIGGRDADWDEALDLVAERFKNAVAEHGPDSVAFYVSGQLLTEDYYVANKLMKGYIGSANIDTNSRLCMASSVAGHKRAFGGDIVPGTYEDLEKADLIVLVGSNLAWCHPVLFQRIAAAKEANPNMRVINIDPRRTATCDLADLHLAIRSDGDSALFNALLTHLADNGHIDESYVTAHVDGFEDALASARASTPADSGLSEDQIATFLQMWAGTEKVVTVYSQGVNQSSCGSDKVNAIVNCHLATGRLGRVGMGPFSVTGQPNAMGGREVGGLANTLACHLDITNPAHRNGVQRAWNSPAMCQDNGLKAVDLFQACADGKIKALWVMSTNPAVSMPDAGAVAEAIKAVPFTVVTDIIARTDTGDLADVLLPASGWGEKSGTVTNSERRISRQRPFLSSPGKARPDWEIICDVATRMGWGDAFTYATVADVFREHAALSGVARSLGSGFDISGLAKISDEEYDTLAPVQWPVPVEGPVGGRQFTDGVFRHPSRRARMIAVTPPPVELRGGAVFELNTGRIRDQWHTMSRTGRAPRLNQHLAEPFAEIHPSDAADLGLKAADLVDLETEQGKATARVLITDRGAAGTVFVPMHWTAQTAPAGRVNALLSGRTDPVSGQPALKSARVRLKRFEAAWFGFVAARDQINTIRPYSAIARTQTGWQGEIAGKRVPSDWEAELRALTNVEGGTVCVMEDPASGLARVALFDDAGLVAVLFAAPEPVQLARGHVITLIGQDIPASIALAGRPAGDQPDPGATVCSCFGIGTTALRAAIAEGASSVDALGEKTCAGTNCGSCKPELAALIAKMKPAMAAE